MSNSFDFAEKVYEVYDAKDKLLAVISIGVDSEEDVINYAKSLNAAYIDITSFENSLFERFWTSPAYELADEADSGATFVYDPETDRITFYDEGLHNKIINWLSDYDLYSVSNMMFHYNSDCARLSSQQIVDWIWQDKRIKKAFMQVFNLTPADNTQEISM